MCCCKIRDRRRRCGIIFSCTENPLVSSYKKCSTAPDYVLCEMSSHAALNHYGESQVSDGMILLNQYCLTDCSGFAGWRTWVEPAAGGSGRHAYFPQLIF